MYIFSPPPQLCLRGCLNRKTGDYWHEFLHLVFDVETYFYSLIDLYNISVIDRSPSPGDNILQPTGKHFKRIARARYPGYQRLFLCLGMLRCRSQCRRIFGQRPNQRVAMKPYDLNRKPAVRLKSL